MALPLAIAVTAAVVLVGGTTALALNPFGKAKATRAPFMLAVLPSGRTIKPTQTASYQIAIRRIKSFRGAVALSITGGVPAGARAGFAPRATTGSRSTLRVITTAQVKPGHYQLRFRATRGNTRVTGSVTLAITAPSPAPFAIGGSTADLHPGAPAGVNLLLTDPGRAVLWITGLSVRIQRIDAPNATAALPCTAWDFSIRQFSGPYPLVVPRSSARTLAQLGIAAAEWPQVLLVNRSANQDGCQGASLTLGFTGNGLFQ